MYRANKLPKGDIPNFMSSAPIFCALRPIPFIRHSAIRRDAVDEAREMLAKLRPEVVGRDARLAGHGLHLIRAENRPQLLR